MKKEIMVRWGAGESLVCPSGEEDAVVEGVDGCHSSPGDEMEMRSAAAELIDL